MANCWWCKIFAVGGCTFINERMNWNKIECVNKGECDEVEGWFVLKFGGFWEVLFTISGNFYNFIKNV